jgi:hypothetical protein
MNEIMSWNQLSFPKRVEIHSIGQLTAPSDQSVGVKPRIALKKALKKITAMSNPYHTIRSLFLVATE